MQQVRLSGFERKRLAEQLVADIDAFCVQTYGEGYRDHLGASTIGETCLRRLVMAFRWMHREQFSGQQLRLFNRGHKEEFRFVEWLKGIGGTVNELAENGKQFRMEGLEQHYGGSLDGQMILPERYQLPIDFLLEMKTHNDRNFKKLVKSGMQSAKPMHYIQMCSYGDAYKLNYGIYIAINKNDDNIHVEVVELDHKVGKKYTERAFATITTKRLPPRVAASPAFDTCKYCPMVGICHLDQPVDVNCRSCANSIAAEAGNWYCSRWKQTIPHDAIPNACGDWTAFQ